MCHGVKVDFFCLIPVQRSGMLNIIVCVKVVTDPGIPASTFKIDPEKRRVVPGQGVPRRVS
jgi:hypothetical protein